MKHEVEKLKYSRDRWTVQKKGTWGSEQVRLCQTERVLG